jgi:hypothetical protein
MILPQARPPVPTRHGWVLWPGDICLDESQPLWQADQTRALLDATLAALHRTHESGARTPLWQQWTRASQEEGRRWR